jgi:hypothetical protein
VEKIKVVDSEMEQDSPFHLHAPPKCAVSFLFSLLKKFDHCTEMSVAAVLHVHA